MARATKSELNTAYLEMRNERDCWELCWRFQMPDWSEKVEGNAGGYAFTETWYLHAAHRMSGPVLRIVSEDSTGAVHESVRFLMHWGSNTKGWDPYRVSALHHAQAFANQIAHEDKSK